MLMSIEQSRAWCEKICILAPTRGNFGVLPGHAGEPCTGGCNYWRKTCALATTAVLRNAVAVTFFTRATGHRRYNCTPPKVSKGIHPFF